eukprot:10577583-Heterocapsa_arctica.AAC.1
MAVPRNGIKPKEWLRAKSRTILWAFWGGQDKPSCILSANLSGKSTMNLVGVGPVSALLLKCFI